MSIRTIVFEKGPFGFDEKGKIRCTKCGDSGWIVDGVRSGLSMKQKTALAPAVENGRVRLPAGWQVEGTFDTQHIAMEAWTVTIKENVHQVRHVDNMRLTMMGVYSGITTLAAAISFVGEFDKWLRACVLFGLAVLTFFQLLFHLKLSKAFEHNMDHVRLLLAVAPDGAQFAHIGLFRQMEGMIIFGRWWQLRILKLVPALFAALTLFWAGAAVRVLLIG